MLLQELCEGMVTSNRLPTKLGLSTATLKELRSWRQNKTSGKYQLSQSAMDELRQNEGVRRTSPVRLYRGLNFDAKMLAKNPELRKMVDEWKTGSLNLTWAKASSWSADRATATLFAKHGTIKLGREDRVHSNEHGVLMSVLAKPENVLLDMTLFDGYSSEDEVILEPGTFTCKVEKHYEGNSETSYDAEADVLEAVSEAKKVVAKVKKYNFTVDRQPLQFLYALHDVRKIAVAMNLEVAKTLKANAGVAFLLKARSWKLQKAPDWLTSKQSDAENPEMLDKLMKAAWTALL